MKTQILPFSGRWAQVFRVLCRVSPAVLLWKGGLRSWGWPCLETGSAAWDGRGELRACGNETRLHHRWAGPWGNGSNTEGSLPFPPGEAAFSWLRLCWHEIQSRAQIRCKPKSPSWNKIAPPNIPVALLSAVLRCSCCGEGRCCSGERKNIKRIASVKQLLRWMSQICLVVLGLFIAVGFACDVVCGVTLHPSWLLPFFS